MSTELTWRNMAVLFWIYMIVFGLILRLPLVALAIFIGGIAFHFIGGQYGKHRRTRRDREHPRTGTGTYAIRTGTGALVAIRGPQGPSSRLIRMREYRDAEAELRAAERRVTQLAGDFMDATRMVAEKRAVFEALPAPEPFPEKTDSLPILAYKACYSRMTDGGRVFLRNVHDHDPIQEDRAVCAKGFDHLVPAVECTCGFYALRSLPANEYEMMGDTWLTVELFGKVIIHESGYRAERQRVLAVQYPGCRHCRGPSTGLLVTQPTTTGAYVVVGPACSGTAAEGAGVLRMITFGELSEQFGVPVSYSPDFPIAQWAVGS